MNYKQSHSGINFEFFKFSDLNLRHCNCETVMMCEKETKKKFSFCIQKSSTSWWQICHEAFSLWLNISIHFHFDTNLPPHFSKTSPRSQSNYSNGIFALYSYIYLLRALKTKKIYSSLHKKAINQMTSLHFYISTGFHIFTQH